MAEGHQIFLTSNSAAFEENTPADFSVHIPQRLEGVEDDWCAALCELSYIANIEDVTSSTHKSLERCIVVKTLKGVRRIVFNAGIYNKPSELVAAINNSVVNNIVPDARTAADINKNDRIQNWLSTKAAPHVITSSNEPSEGEEFSLKIDHSSNRVILKTGRIVTGVLFHGSILQKLGFKEAERFPASATEYVGEGKPDVKGQVDAIYVYCDIIENQVLSSARVPILRICEIPRKRIGERVFLNFPDPPYFPLASKTIDIIHIKLTDSFGNLIKFQGGVTVARLHLRPRKSLLL